MKSYSNEIVTKEQIPQPDKLVRINAILSLFLIAIITIILLVFVYGIYHYDMIHFMDSLQVFLTCPKK
jgi:hypothetical protein